MCSDCSFYKNRVNAGIHIISPSVEDFNCFVEAGYKIGVVLCHDGSVYIYSAKNVISSLLMEMYTYREFKICRNEKEAQLKALDKFVKTGDIYYEEIINI